MNWRVRRRAPEPAISAKRNPEIHCRRDCVHIIEMDPDQYGAEKYQKNYE